VKKVLLVSKHYYPMDRPSGVVSLVNECAAALHAQGHKVYVACVSTELPSDQWERHSDGWLVRGFSLMRRGALPRLNEQEKFDHIVVFSSVSNGSLLFFWWCYILTDVLSITTFYQTTNLNLSWLGARVLKWLQKKVNGIFCASKSTFDLLKKSGIDSNIVLPGLNVSSLSVLADSEKTADVCFMGHLTHVKGADVVVDISQLMPSSRFMVVAGYSPGKANLDFYRAIVNRIASLENISHLGMVEQPISKLAQCRVLILPYRSGVTVLGVAQSAIEAMALGIPVLATRNSALNSLIVDDQNGFFCETAESFKVKIEMLLNDIELYSRLAKGAVDTIRKRHDARENTKKLLVTR